MSINIKSESAVNLKVIRTSIWPSAILDGCNMAIILFNKELDLQSFTLPAKRIFNLKASDLGQTISNLACCSADDCLLMDIRSALDRNVSVTREIVVDGDQIYLRTVASYENEVGKEQEIVITIAEKPQATQTVNDLWVFSALISNIVEAVKEPLLILDRILLIHAVNDAFCNLFHTRPEQLIGISLNETCGRQFAQMLNGILDGVRGSSHQIRNLPVDIPGRDRQVLRIRISKFTSDLSAEQIIVVKFESILGKDRLEKMMEICNKKAEAANLTKSRFLAAASHDLRQPLQTLRILSSILQRKLTDQETILLNTKCRETIDGMAETINTILDINQLEAGSIRPSIQNFSVSTLLNMLESEFKLVAQAKGLDYRVVKSQKVLRSDPRLLVQILRNLINNAIKFTQSGKLLLGCRSRGGKVAIEAYDTGPGILESDREKIFNFFQKGQTNAVDDGLGLGLAIVKQLSDILGHEISVVSRVGKGSCFSVRVDGGGQAAEPQIAKSGPSLQSLRGQDRHHILIIEDEPSLIQSLKLLLRGAGYEIATASTGKEALDLTRSDPHWLEILLVDYNIPGGLNGLEVIDEVRAVTGRYIPAAVLSGDISFATSSKIQAKADAHLTKPVRTEELLDVLQSLLGEAPPQAFSKSSAAMPPPPPREQGGGPICIINDDSSVRDALRRMLECFGYSVVTYLCGEEYLRAPSTEPASCLILDSCMPGVDGFEVLTRVTKRGEHPPVILITGFGDVKMAVKAIKAGAFDFIEKPIDPDELRNCVDRALQSVKHNNHYDPRQEVSANSITRLTKRQRAVLDLIVQGNRNKIIAYRLGIGQRTVESHRATIMKKLHVKTFADLIRVALGTSI